MTPLDKKRRKKLQAILDKNHGYRDYHDNDVAVGKIGKYGSGVFAQRQFLPGELVIEVHGQLLSQKNYDGSSYVMEVNKDWFLEPAIPAAFLNHSCDPNCELVHLTKWTMGLVAICNIEAETQITFDYRWTAFEGVPKCQCGSPVCRGWVVAAEDVKKMERIAKRKKKKS
ncbi:SET domain-containing protein [Novipirellula artificiosorum]|uniref:SET domain protein n=1 Tax=Novipirellula artificiosorum TaxID=2528016 RepID=A0A5C6DJY4_9BACT|nr:SET domain-containing protein-lysine N-methyltransferase [Novipirellula artificiosorum]TWU35169.1 SET domain protein [Novipirellula artificiosorum]